MPHLVSPLDAEPRSFLFLSAFSTKKSDYRFCSETPLKQIPSPVASVTPLVCPVALQRALDHFSGTRSERAHRPTVEIPLRPYTTRDLHFCGPQSFLSCAFCPRECCQPPVTAMHIGVLTRRLTALVHNSDRSRELAWPRLASPDHFAIRHPERRHGVQNLAPDPCLDSLCRQPSRSHR